MLCRLALGAGSIDAASFTAIRIVSGAVMLLAVAAVTRRGGGRRSWISAAMLFLYAVGFSFAYLDLHAGTGALLLFGAVQMTMLGVAIARGERPPVGEWIGIALALGGLVYLVAPGLEAPSIRGAVLMLAAGAAWGVYTLRGRGSANPVGETAGNFLRAAVPAVAVGAIGMSHAHATTRGVLLAVTSGAITSGLGYVIWYAALRGLTATRAALVQLAVPLIAAIAGVLLIGEHITVRLVAAAVLILGGIALALLSRGRKAAS